MSRKDDLDNRSNQLNDNNDAYWQSRGYDERPDDWDSNQVNGSTMPNSQPKLG